MVEVNTNSKISFIGDIMCERPFLNAAKKRRDKCFQSFLEPCRTLFSESDIVVGNLETPCDPNSPLTKDMFVFNAPISFVEAIKDSGIELVTTATNHCLDRGLSGLENTIHTLDRIGLKHTGTFLNDKQERFEILPLSDGTKIAIVSYTYGTNYMDNHIKIEPKDYYSINYLTPLYEGRNGAYDGMSHSLRAKITRAIPRGLRVKVNTMLGRATNLSFQDKLQEGDLREQEKESIALTLKKASALADVVVICPHFGGQFNTTPGSYVNTFVELFDSLGVDLVVGNHPHVVQPFDYTESGMRVAYSLGNVSMSLSTPYVVLKDHPDCSVMLHLYINNGKIVNTSFSVLIEKEDNGYISVHPLYDLYNESDDEYKAVLQKKNSDIYNRFLGVADTTVPVLKEYSFE